MRFLLFFWMGMVLRQTGTAWLETIPVAGWGVVDLALFALWMSIDTQENGLLWKLISKGLLVLLQIFGALMAFIILNKIAKRVRFQQNKIFHVLSTYMFPIYLFHQQIIYCVLDTWNGKVSPIVLAVLCFSIAITGSLFLSWLLGKNKMTRFLIGMK